LSNKTKVLQCLLNFNSQTKHPPSWTQDSSATPTKHTWTSTLGVIRYTIQSGLHNYIIHGLLLVLSSDAFSWRRRSRCWTRTRCSSVPRFRPQVSSCRSCKSPATEQNLKMHQRMNKVD